MDSCPTQRRPEAARQVLAVRWPAARRWNQKT